MPYCLLMHPLALDLSIVQDCLVVGVVLAAVAVLVVAGNPWL